MSLMPAFAAALTALWLALAYRHIGADIGWDNLQTLAFHEQAIIWIACLVPVGFLWLIVVMFRRDWHLHTRINKLITIFDSFLTPSHEANQYAQDALAKMKEQAALFEISSTTMAKKAETFLTRLDQKISEMNALETQLSQDCHTVETNINAQLERIRDTTDRVSARSEYIRRNLRQAVDSFDQAAEDTRKKTQKTQSAFESYALRVDALATKTRQHEKDLIENISRQNESLQSATDKASDQARYVRETFSLYADALQKSADIAQERADSLGIATQKQIQSTNEAQMKIEKMTEKSANMIETMLGNMQKGGDDFTRLIDNTMEIVKTQGNTLTDVSQRSNETIQHFSQQLSKADKQINISAAQAAETLQTVCGHLTRHVDLMAESGTKISAHISQITEKFVAQSTQIKQISQTSIEDFTRTSQTVEKTFINLGKSGSNILHALAKQDGSLQQHILELRTTAGQAVTHIGEQQKVLEKKLGTLSTLSNHMQEALHTIQQKIVSLGQDIKAIWEQSSSHAREINARLHTQKMDFEQIAQTVEERATTIGNSLQKQVVTLNQKVKDFGKTAQDTEEGFRSQMDELLDMTKDMETRAEEAAKKNIVNRRGGFLEASSFVVEKLQSLSVDIARLLDPQASGDDWDRYLAGDKGIFTRLLGRRRHANMNTIIRKKIKEDEQFRNYVLEYMSEFKSLIGQARALDHNQVLEKAFLSADVGKVYTLLEKALETKS